jgi:hypothetical protein
MSILYRGPSINASYQDSVHLATWFQRRRLLEQINWNLVGSTYGRFCIKFHQNRMKGERHRVPTEPLVFVIRMWWNIYMYIIWRDAFVLDEKWCQSSNWSIYLKIYFLLIFFLVLPTKFQLIWPNGFREDFFQLANHKQDMPMVAKKILYRLSGCRGEGFL